MNSRLNVLIGVACLTGAATVANATSVRRMGTPELVARAQLVVHGTVIENYVVYDNGPNGPANVRTITKIQVTESLKGNAGATVTVAGFGGQVGDLIYELRGTPKFVVGEETLVILSPPAPHQKNMRSFFAPLGAEGSLMVEGFEQGRFKINQDADGGKVAVRSAEGLEFAGEVAMDVEKQARPLNEVVAEIKAIVEIQRVEAERLNTTGGAK